MEQFLFIAEIEGGFWTSGKVFAVAPTKDVAVEKIYKKLKSDPDFQERLATGSELSYLRETLEAAEYEKFPIDQNNAAGYYANWD